MSSDPSIWYRVGYALERAKARKEPPDDDRDARGPGVSSERGAQQPAWPTADDLVASGTAALVARVLTAWRPSRGVSASRLLRAGLAGAGAALLLDLVRPLLKGRAELPQVDGATGARLLAGASQGLIYGATIEPRLPGPPIVKGAVFALAEYMAHPAGGLSRFLGAQTLHGRIPVVRDLLEELEPEDREYVEHLVFGVALAILCGPGPSANGPEQEIDE
jgi:hypothetical protein